MTEFEITSERVGVGAVVLRITGEIDLAVAPRLEERLRAALAGGPTDVIVDLSRCEYLDSSGLSVFAQADRGNGDRPRVVLVMPEDGIVRVSFGVTKLDEVFEIYSTLDEAISSRNGAPAATTER